MDAILRAVAGRALGALAVCPACLAAPCGPSGVCEACRAWLSAAVAAAPPPVGDRCWLGAYAGPWERLVTALKLGGARRLATLLGELLAARVLAWGWRPDLVTHVPASPGRLDERGFDQAALLAAALAGVVAAPTLPLLRRRSVSRSQRGLSRGARAANAAASFEAGRRTTGRVLLVDDVLTTGATVEACAAALEGAGATEVRVAVVARTVRGDAPPGGDW